MKIRTDCKFFRGDIPCDPHKTKAYKCDNCSEYQKVKNKILIIKLGAIGDVIRTTPILRKIKKDYKDSLIFWLTSFPDALSNNWVDNIIPLNFENIEYLKKIKFDWLINLDKDKIAISLSDSIYAKKKSGFTIDKYGHTKPFSKKAEYQKWLTGLFDDLNKANTKHYVEEIFDICGFPFNNEEYIVEKTTEKLKLDIDKVKKKIGLNTGCGERWSSRLWPIEHWKTLAKKLLDLDYEVILLGGEQEHQKNLEIQKETGAKYFGHFPLPLFISLLNECDLIISAVTLAMHLSIGLRKKIILFNNIFNKNEFYLYERGEILEPDYDCTCFFSKTCENNCMQYLLPATVVESVLRILPNE